MDHTGGFLKECIHSTKEFAGICTCSVVLEVACTGWNDYQQPKNLKKSPDLIHATTLYRVVAADGLRIFVILIVISSSTATRIV